MANAAEIAFCVGNSRGRTSCLVDGNERRGEQMAEELPPVRTEESSTLNLLKLSSVDHSASQTARSINVRVRETAQRPLRTRSTSSADRENVFSNDECSREQTRSVSRFNIDDDILYTSSRTPRTNLSEGNKIFITVVIFLTIFSITVTSYVGYLVLIRDGDCDCSDANAEASALTTAKSTEALALAPMNTDRENETPKLNNRYEQMRAPRLARNHIYPTCLPSRTRTANINLSNRNKIFILVVVCLTLLSMTASGYVGYLVVIRNRDCNCSEANVSGMAFTTVSGVNHELMRNTIKTFIENFRKELQEITNQTDDVSNSTCNKNTADCFKERIENLSTRLREAKTEAESLLDKTKERTTNELEMTSIKAQKLKNMQDPQCMLKINEKRSSERLVTVPVETTNVVTLGVTCSTSSTHPAKVWYLTPPSKDHHNYTCYCHNDDGKMIDCVAYYWQCKLP